MFHFDKLLFFPSFACYFRNSQFWHILILSPAYAFIFPLFTGSLYLWAKVPICADRLLKVLKAALLFGVQISVPQSTQKNLKVSKSTSKYLKVAKSSQKYQKVPQSTQKYLKVPKSSPKYLKVTKSTSKYPNVPQSSQKYLKVPISTSK